MSVAIVLPAHRERIDPGAGALLVLLCAIWGVGQVAVKVGIEGIPPVLQAGLRSAGATALVLLWCRARGVPLFARDGTGPAGLLAGTLFAVEFLLLYPGLGLTTAARGVVFLYTVPFVVAVGAHFLVPGDRLTRRKAAGLGLAFTGLAVAFADSLRLPSARELIGDLLCLGAAVFWGATTLVIKVSRLASHAPAEKTLLYQLGVSAALLPVASLLLGEVWMIRPSGPVVAAFLYQTVVVAFASYAAWFWLVARYPASLLSAFSFLTPIFGVAAGALLLDEPVTPALALAVALIAAGIWLVNRPASPAAVARPAG